jgi:hypothetical protein
MRLKLKENPREWQKFTLATMAALSLASFLLYRRHGIGSSTFSVVLNVAGLALVTCGLWPRWYRWFYRAGMTAGFHVGQVMGRILLTCLFFVVVTPLGLLLRLSGKDLLGVKKDPHAKSYWRPTRPNPHYDRPF